MSAPKAFTNTVTGKVVRVIRHGHTASGNPTMSIDLEPVALTPGAGTWMPSDPPLRFRISNDAALVYAIENREYRDEPHVFDVTAAGRISGYTRTVAEHAKLSGRDRMSARTHTASRKGDKAVISLILDRTREHAAEVAHFLAQPGESFDLTEVEGYTHAEWIATYTPTEREAPEQIADRILDALDTGENQGSNRINDAFASGWFVGDDVRAWLISAAKEARA